ncbi:hypothetical protein B0O99DRAFT_83821 [Bisporella sp. PMI_857]|nr:hypothetical protein B0O99DRAFT_83821 [Bisporella sp. PMI_857]
MYQIFDTYRAYKAKEQKVLSWLKDSVKDIGGNSYIKEGPDHEIPINRIPNIVEFLISHGRLLPTYLHVLLRDLIVQRKEASAFYKATGSGSAKAEAGHAHYLVVLESALNAFDKAATLSKNSVKTRVVSKAAPAHSRSDVAFNNLFISLEVEGSSTPVNDRTWTSNEESDKEDAGLNKATESKNSNGKGKGKGSKSKGKGKGKGKGKNTLKSSQKATTLDAWDFQLKGIDKSDLNGDGDLYFMIYCFFKDFNSVREYIQERWCDYQDGLLALSAVSLVTNTAFELFQRAEKELLSQIPSRDPLRQYQAMAHLLFFDRGLAHVDYAQAEKKYADNIEVMDEQFYDEMQWVCMDINNALEAWLHLCPPGKVPTVVDFLQENVDYRPSDVKGKMLRDKRIAHELLQEGTMMRAIRKYNENFSIPGEDEFTLGIIRMMTTRHVPIWLIFATRVQVDIRCILENDAIRCHEELQMVGKRINFTLGNYCNFTKNTFVPQHSAIKTTLNEIECWITCDFAEPDRRNLFRRNGIDQELEPFYYLRRNPLLCGLMIFRFSLTMNELGLKTANQWGSTIAVAHLYNALTHEVDNFPQWPDMEALILIHSNQRIFWLDRLPESPAQYSSSYERATGVTSMTKQRRTTTNGSMITPSKIRSRGIAPVSVVSKVFWERFCFDHGHSMPTLPEIEQILNSTSQTELELSLSGLTVLNITGRVPQIRSMAAKDVGQNASQKELTRQFEETRTLTNIQLLDTLSTLVSQEAYALNFDYFSFHIRCTLILKAIYAEFAPEIDAMGEEALDWRNGELSLIPHYVFQLLHDEQKKDDAFVKLSGAMERILKDEGNREIIAVREFVGIDLVDIKY